MRKRLRRKDRQDKDVVGTRDAQGISRTPWLPTRTTRMDPRGDAAVGQELSRCGLTNHDHAKHHLNTVLRPRSGRKRSS
jgi:hypothetical protein